MIVAAAVSHIVHELGIGLDVVLQRSKRPRLKLTVMPFEVVRIDVMRADVAALVEGGAVVYENVVGDVHMVGRTRVPVVPAAAKDDAAAAVENRVVDDCLVAVVVPAV